LAGLQGKRQMKFQNLKPKPLQEIPTKTLKELAEGMGEQKPVKVPDGDLNSIGGLNFANYMRLIYDWTMREVAKKAGYIESEKYSIWELLIKLVASLFDFLGAKK